jgi:hypothetical protein
MKKFKNNPFHAFYLLIIACTLTICLCTLHKSMDKVEECQEILSGYHTGSHYGKTQDADLYNIDYEWYIDHNISEEDNLKIDLVIKRTLAKSFQYYTTEQLLAIPNDATTDIKNRIEDAVFVLQPYGWHLSKLSIYPEK